MHLFGHLDNDAYINSSDLLSELYILLVLTTYAGNTSSKWFTLMLAMKHHAKRAQYKRTEMAQIEINMVDHSSLPFFVIRLNIVTSTGATYRPQY